MDRPQSMVRPWWVVLMILGCLGINADASAQLGALVSPGRLSRPHTEFEGVANCLSCHTVGRGISADKCLSCHEPVAERIARRTGVHRDVTTDCVTCHVEHAGVEAELRPFDQTQFDHASDTRFALDGVHASATCEACHTTRSFLTVASSCVSCHEDPHAPTLGAQCETCHDTHSEFSAVSTGFDHSGTQFPLTGAHAATMCASCHENKVYRGLAFTACTDCHTDPHVTPMGAPCASCHTTVGWGTTRVDHAQTTFPLVGKHAPVACVECHTQPAVQVRLVADTCATCHDDPHAGVFDEDCAACHTESGFEDGTFDHSTTDFPLVDQHSDLECLACHTTAADSLRGSGLQTPTLGGLALQIRPVASSPRPGAVALQEPVDFRGLSTACASCHMDVHQEELGTSCEQCHSQRTFEITEYTHADDRPFFAGTHLPVGCNECHDGTLAAVGAQDSTPLRATEPPLRIGFARTATSCVSCHDDVHLGQVGTECERCHSIETAQFALAGFSHDDTSFPLIDKHAPLECDACHSEKTHDFPAGRGTATQLTGLGTECISCHRDQHAGQLVASCETCHSQQTFALADYSHQNQRALREFFAGKHLTVECSACHQARETEVSRELVVSYLTSTACDSCHNDVHRGALGTRCESCHRP